MQLLCYHNAINHITVDQLNNDRMIKNHARGQTRRGKREESGKTRRGTRSRSDEIYNLPKFLWHGR